MISFQATRVVVESSKYIACAIVCPRLHYANSCLSGISSYNIHRLQQVQNCLAHVVHYIGMNCVSALHAVSNERAKRTQSNNV